MLLVTIFRGSKKFPSEFVEPCSAMDFTSVTVYCGLMLIICVYAVKTIRWEQMLK